MRKGIFALRSAPKVKRIARTLFWLALISAATRHELLLGVVLYLIAAAVVVAISLSPVLLAGGCLLAWYWYRHRRLPGWLSRRAPRRLRSAVRRIWRRSRGRLMDVFPGRARRVRRRWPRPPASWEAPTDELRLRAVPAREPADLAADLAVAGVAQRNAPPLP